MWAGGAWILRTTIGPRNLVRGLLLAGLVPFLQRRQTLGVRKLSKFQKLAANRDSSARDRRNWETPREAPSLLHLSVGLSRSQNDDSDLSRLLQVEIRETLIRAANAGHIRKISTHDKGPPALRGQLSNFAKLTAALWYLNRLPPGAELRPLLPALKVELESPSPHLDDLQVLLDRATSARLR